MARTVKKGYDERGNIVNDGTTRSYHARESKWARKMTNRKARGKANEALRTFGDPEALVIDDNPSTSGWISH